MRTPCTNSDGSSTLEGFTQGILGDRNYSVEELNDAAVTIFGELSIHFNALSGEEAVAIASIIFNRSTANANGTAPRRSGGGSLWGASPSLSDVVSARNRFAGLRTGQAALQTGFGLNEGDDNCDRLKAAGSALAYLATNPQARRPYLYMCAEGHITTPHPDDVHINGNVFSVSRLVASSHIRTK